MVVVAHCEGHQIGLVVEELIGQQQVVIKTLGERFAQVRGISGAAILGDGRVGLILEMPGLAAAHQARMKPSDRPRQENLDTDTGEDPIEDKEDSPGQEAADAGIQVAPEPVGA
jgi:chemotaxis protein histidine kinase CheA